MLNIEHLKRKIFQMLKLIAEDFIQIDKIDIVLPLYKELVEKTKLEQGCIL